VRYLRRIPFHSVTAKLSINVVDKFEAFRVFVRFEDRLKFRSVASPHQSFFDQVHPQTVENSTTHDGTVPRDQRLLRLFHTQNKVA
jgi:hypothetical protein